MVVKKHRPGWGCIYHAVNKKNQKGYVGQDKSGYPETHRWPQHAKAARKGSKFYFHYALRKNGYEVGFTWEVVWRGPVELLNKMETYYIKKLHTFIDDPLGGGYNLTTGGGQFKMSKKTRNKIAAISKAQWADSEIREHHAIKPETLEKLSKAQLAAWASESGTTRRAKSRTPEARARAAAVSIALWQDPDYATTHRTEETRAAAGARSKARWADPEYKARLRVSLSQPEAVAPRTASIKTKSCRSKMSESAKARWADPVEHDKAVGAIRRGMQTEAGRKNMVEAAKVRASRPEELLRLSTIASKCWSDPVRRVEVIAAQKLGRIRAEEARRLANAEEK